MRRGGIPAGKTFQNPGGTENAGLSGANFNQAAGATGQSQARGAASNQNFFGGAGAAATGNNAGNDAPGTMMINTSGNGGGFGGPGQSMGGTAAGQGAAGAGSGSGPAIGQLLSPNSNDQPGYGRRRSTVGKKDKGGDDNAKTGDRRQSVEEVLNQFRNGNRDVNQAYQTIKATEGESIPDILAALEQLSDILCQVTYFSKAYEILSTAAKDINGSPVLHELIARVAFVMEDFKKCIFHNSKAAKLQPEECSHNKSDMGLAYYRLGLQTGDTKHFESGFKFCREALELNSMNSNAMVNMGLIYKHQNGIEDALKMFKAARQHDPANVAAIVNIGCIEYEEFKEFEQAAILFLDALELKPDDDEALCNLALALKRTSYIDYAKMAFEEAVNVSPGNTFILTNYMMFLLEQQNFEQFTKVLPHARRVMDKQELDTVQNLHDQFKEAIEGTAGKSIPEDDSRASSAFTNKGETSGRLKTFSTLKNNLQKKLQGIGSSKPAVSSQMQPVVEGEEDNY